VSGIGPIRFRGRSFIAFALARGLPVIEWLAQLDDWMRNSNGFFVGRAVILDLTSIALRRAEIEHLLSELQTRGIRIMGLEGAEPELLAIDRFYRTAEDIDASLHGRASQAWLEGDILRIAAVD